MTNADTALTRENLMRQIESSWNELQNYIASLTEEQLTQPTDAAGWTAKDHLIHIAVWENAGIAMLEGKSKRETMDVPQEIWDQDDDPINAVIQQRYHDMPLDEVKQTLQDVHARMVKKIDSMTEEDLQLPYRHYQPHATDERPIIRYIVGDTIHHYRDHMPWIAAIVEPK